MLEGGVDDRAWRTQQRREHGVDIEASLTRGADDTGEDLLRVRAARRTSRATSAAHGLRGWSARSVRQRRSK
jgi:hypothetical protein